MAYAPCANQAPGKSSPRNPDPERWTTDPWIVARPKNGCSSKNPPGRSDSSRALADHVSACAACQRRLGDLARIEQTWRAIPLPTNAQTGPDRFRSSSPASAALPPTRNSRPKLPVRWLVAASILIVAAISGGLFMRASTRHRLNGCRGTAGRLEPEPGSCPSVVERGQIYADHVTRFQDELKRAEVPAHDRDLVQTLLERAPELVRIPDPLAEADRFNELAEKLLARMSDATQGGDTRRINQSAALYRRVAELGIEPKLEVLEASRSLDFERLRRLERLILQDSDRLNTLVKLLERAPDSSRRQIKRALGITRRKRRVPPVRSAPATSLSGKDSTS